MNELYLWVTGFVLTYIILVPIFSGLAYRWTVIFPKDKDQTRVSVSFMWGLFWPVMIMYCLVVGSILLLGLLFILVSGYEPPTEKDKK